MTAYGQMPHCDSRILHAPSVCDFCDQYPEWQKAREMWGINFTGEYDPQKEICPSERKRVLRNIEKWHGNVPIKGNQSVSRQEVPFHWLQKEYWNNHTS